MSLQDTLDEGTIDSSTVPVMPDIEISLTGILKLLSDNLRPALLKELWEETALILQVIFTNLLSLADCQQTSVGLM